MSIIKAIQNLRPKARWDLLGDKVVWHDKKQTQPTDAAIRDEMRRIESGFSTEMLESAKVKQHITHGTPKTPEEEEAEYYKSSISHLNHSRPVKAAVKEPDTPYVEPQPIDPTDLDETVETYVEHIDDVKAKEIIETINEPEPYDYVKLRKAEFDKLNQFEILYDDLMNDTCVWAELIEGIKEKYPKPEEK
jgi:hypothetical protein